MTPLGFLLTTQQQFLKSQTNTLERIRYLLKGEPQIKFSSSRDGGVSYGTDDKGHAAALLLSFTLIISRLSPLLMCSKPIMAGIKEIGHGNLYEFQQQFPNDDACLAWNSPRRNST